LVKYIVSRFSFTEFFCADVEALGDGMQSGTVFIEGGEVDVVVGVVVGDADSLSFESLPHPTRASARTTIARHRATITSLLSLETALYLPRVERVDRDNLRPAPLPADDSHRAARNSEHRGQELDERLVRTPTLRRSRHAHLPALTVPPDELGSPCARRDRDANPSR
jgi:hypothetical protein